MAMKRNAQTNAKRTAKRAAMPRGECGATAVGAQVRRGGSGGVWAARVLAPGECVAASSPSGTSPGSEKLGGV